MNRREFEILEEIKIFEREKRELQTAMAHSLYEEVTRGFDNSVSVRYKEAIELANLRIVELWVELDRVSDCESFIHEFGQDCHNEFKRQYPINHKTELRKESMLAKLKTFRYELPTKSSVYPIDKIPTAYTPLDTRWINVNEFYIPNRGYILFAYMPETNILLWYQV